MCARRSPDGRVRSRWQSIVDRLTAGAAVGERLRDSLETAFTHGSGRRGGVRSTALRDVPFRALSERPRRGVPASCRDGHPSTTALAAARLLQPPRMPRLPPHVRRSRAAAVQLQQPARRLPDLRRLRQRRRSRHGPDRARSGASRSAKGRSRPGTRRPTSTSWRSCSPWPPTIDIPVDVPFRELTAEHLRLIREGVPERNFGGLRGFFAWLEKRKYKMHLRVFLNRWRSSQRLPHLPRHAAATRKRWPGRVGGRNIAEVCAAARSTTPLAFLRRLAAHRSRAARRPHDARSRSARGWASCSRSAWAICRSTARCARSAAARRSGSRSRRRSASAWSTCCMSSTSRRSACTRAMSSGWSARFAACAIAATRVVVVEHEEALLRAADQLIEIGPGAGDRGGEVVFQGHARRDARARRQPDRRVPRRPPRRLDSRAPPADQSRLDQAARGARQQPARTSPSSFRWACCAW